LFAAAHLYYGLLFGIASIGQFLEITAFGLAMAVTYYYSKGNLAVPALIHGAYDASGFVGVAVSDAAGIFLRSSLVLAGIVVACFLLTGHLRYRSRNRDHG
jgi:membrane protease YdiL (CAAX protease family)